MQMAKYLVDNRAAITTRLKEMKKPTLSKLELEKERLYKSLDGSTLSERLETYSQISDVRLRIEKLAKLSEIIENYMRMARIFTNEFDIKIAKELFSSLIIKEFEVHLIVSLSGNEIIKVPVQENRIQVFNKEIMHLFQKRTVKFVLHVH